jgi:hypothetical protein
MRSHLLHRLAIRRSVILALGVTPSPHVRGLGRGGEFAHTPTPAGEPAPAPNARERRVLPSAACGRPYIVEGQVVVASLVDTTEWRGDLRVPNVARLTRAQRDALGLWWSNVGLMEHASIAAFARFTLQLLQLGAPPEFVELSQRALADETTHAKLAFSLAGAYLGRAVGPGVLPAANALEPTALCDVLRLAVREGCIGETVAALEAGHALSHCTVPEVRAVLVRIAHDENAHSDLAWRFVRWALDVEPALVDVLLAECSAAAEEVTRPCEDGPASARCPSSQESTWLQHGAVPPRESAELRRLAIEGVVLPCAQAFVHARTSIQPSWY